MPLRSMFESIIIRSGADHVHKDKETHGNLATVFQLLDMNEVEISWVWYREGTFHGRA